MILGIGLDAFAPSRLARLLREDLGAAGEFFLQAEIAGIGTSDADLRRLATIFAIKEAAFKALAPPPSAGARWREVAVRLDRTVPTIGLTGALAIAAEGLQPLKLHVATAGCGDLVVALAIAETIENSPT